MKWSAYAAECIDCIVRPCVQKPLVLPSLPDQCFLHGMILLSWRPKNWKIKKRGDVCMEGAREREKEKGAPLACLLTDGLTPEHGAVCVQAS